MIKTWRRVEFVLCSTQGTTRGFNGHLLSGKDLTRVSCQYSCTEIHREEKVGTAAGRVVRDH